EVKLAAGAERIHLSAGPIGRHRGGRCDNPGSMSTEAAGPAGASSGRPGTPDAAPGPIRQAIEGLGEQLIQSIATLGGISLLGVRVLREAVRPPFRVSHLFSQLDFVGVGSILIVLLPGLLTGLVFA